MPVTKNKVQKLKFNNDFCNLFYNCLTQYSESVSLEELSDSCRFLLDDFCDKLIAELGNFVGAFEID